MFKEKIRKERKINVFKEKIRKEREMNKKERKKKEEQFILDKITNCQHNNILYMI